MSDHESSGFLSQEDKNDEKLQSRHHKNWSQSSTSALLQGLSANILVLFIG